MKTNSITVPLTERTYTAYMADLDETIARLTNEDEKFSHMARKKRVAAMFARQTKTVDKKGKAK